MSPIFDSMWIAVVAVCWLIVALGTFIAVFSPRINDTLTERLCLGGVGVGAVATAWRVYETEYMTLGFRFTSVCLAAYVLSIFWKHRPAAWRRKS